MPISEAGGADEIRSPHGRVEPRNSLRRGEKQPPGVLRDLPGVSAGVAAHNDATVEIPERDTVDPSQLTQHEL